MTAPAHVRALWKVGEPLPVSDLPIWSGRGEPPAVGDVVTCSDRKGTRVTVTGYLVEGTAPTRWLLVEGFRTDEPTRRGNLAGAEILYPEPEA